MTEIYPESYYRDPANAQTDLAKEQRRASLKVERKRYRAEVGCQGCSRYLTGVKSCGEGQTPNEAGFCGHWWDMRPGKPAPEIK